MPNALRKSRLSELEAIVERTKDAFIELCTAMREIRDEKLYLEEYRTFEEYCEKRWDFSAGRGRQLSRAAEVIENVKSATIVAPDNEAQVRALASIEKPADQRKVWKQAVATAPKREDGTPKVTAAHVAETRRAVVNDPPPMRKKSDLDKLSAAIDDAMRELGTVAHLHQINARAVRTLLVQAAGKVDAWRIGR